MACGITALNSNSGCALVQGGILYTYAVKKSDISSITFTSGLITAMTLGVGAGFVKLEYDIDNTALFEQPATRNNNIITHAQRAFVKFKGLFTAAGRAWAQAAQECCDLVLIHRMATGEAVVQGVEGSSVAAAGFTGTQSLATRFIGNMTTDVGGGENRLEGEFQGVAYSFAPLTDLTDSEIEAL